MSGMVHSLEPVADDRAAAGRSGTVRVDAVVGLAAMFEPHVNVVVLERAAHLRLPAYARSLASGGPFSFRDTIAVGEADGWGALDALARGLPPDDARDVLIEDVAYWAEVVAELGGVKRVGVRLVTMSAPMCPRFHVDHVPFRLTCAYAGGGTEWIDEAYVDRAALRGGAVEAAIRRDAHVARSAPLDVVLLKGMSYPGHEGTGAVHRSPAVESFAPRLLLTVEPLG